MNINLKLLSSGAARKLRQASLDGVLIVLVHAIRGFLLWMKILGCVEFYCRWQPNKF